MSEKVAMSGGRKNVFLDLGFSKAEADSLRLRSQLMMRILDTYRDSGISGRQAQRAFGITAARLRALLQGRIGQFSLDQLVRIAAGAGLQVKFVVTSPRRPAN